MSETRRMTIEQVAGDERRKISLEQSIDESRRDTPAWDRMTSGAKEGLAEKGALFCRSFMAGLVPSVVIAVIILAVFIVIIMGGE
ncbi:MAG: hypothetical protein MUD12_16770 [Spirochaetes bacterium]|jgi:hypothetical protein|nr:hypothetical protein [Spirochaetota bacterium]